MLTKKQKSDLEKLLDPKDESLIRIFNALSDKNRFQIVKILAQHKDICVGDFGHVFGVTSSAISQHMRVLSLNGIVSPIRKGQMSCYQLRLDNPLVKSVIKLFF